MLVFLIGIQLFSLLEELGSFPSLRMATVLCQRALVLILRAISIKRINEENEAYIFSEISFILTKEGTSAIYYNIDES